MQKTAITAAPVLPVIAERWSPRAYDEHYEITQHEILSILEAGRWAPSANNGQPWRFSVITRNDQLAEKFLPTLGRNADWSHRASAHIVISALNVKEDGTPYLTAGFDSGLAAQNMMLQVRELGLHVRPIGGVDRDAMREVLDLPANLNIIAVLVIGKRADAKVLEGTWAYDLEVSTRVRHDLDDIVLHGKP
jgi:nitroreductase